MRIQNASVCFDGKMALDNISLDIQPGELIALIGPNGSGKSTLLKALSGQLPLRNGTLLLDGRRVDALAPRERAACIAYFPQHRPVPDMDVSTLVSHGRFPYLGFGRVMSERDEELIQSALTRANLLGLAHRPLASLSGGERQRAYLAMLMAQDSDILLLDEPATFLDISHQLEVLTILRDLNKLGKTVVFAAHDLPGTFDCARRILLLQDGRIVCDGPPHQLMESSVLSKIFGVNITRATHQDALFSYELSK
ncbi:ABC transporter ATP-binding protein [Ruminococcaceae bacterium OttesenSCG-928-A11]|nr:ABC transporter ATP-binding protein [Oscillospiraceae bacterium OttesenSCG-928-F05]MDL2327769.1 ABC transporter ATP-binding protein [Ruminococcaceae bacterium OttesenSCG-928-A11]